MAGAPVRKFYQSVVDDVIQNVKEAFLDEGADEQILLELKQLWESKLLNSKAVEQAASEQEQVLSRAQQQASAQKNKHLQPAAHLPVPSATPAVRASQAIPAPQVVTHIPMFGATNAVGATAVGGLTPAAQAAALALPPTFYQQQFAIPGNSFIFQTSSGQFLATAAAPNTLTLPTTRTDATKPVLQLDGVNDSSSEEEEEEEKFNDDEDEQNEETEEQGEEGDPLNSDDDISNEDHSDVFDTENVVVCQFDKINRAKNKWRFHLKDGIMNLNGKDFVFQRAIGEGEW